MTTRPRSGAPTAAGAAFVVRALPGAETEQALYQKLPRTNGRLEQEQRPAAGVAALRRISV